MVVQMVMWNEREYSQFPWLLFLSVFLPTTQKPQ